MQHSEEIPLHSFMMGMKVEALHPIDYTKVYPATVVEVWGDTYFLVELDIVLHQQGEDEPKLLWLCTANHPYIFPTGMLNSHHLKSRC